MYILTNGEIYIVKKRRKKKDDNTIYACGKSELDIVRRLGEDIATQGLRLAQIKRNGGKPNKISIIILGNVNITELVIGQVAWCHLR